MCTALQQASKLQHLEINSGDAAKVSGDLLEGLPAGLQTLALSMDSDSQQDMESLGRLTQLSRLEIGQRDSVPLYPIRVQQVMRYLIKHCLSTVDY